MSTELRPMMVGKVKDEPRFHHVLVMFVVPLVMLLTAMQAFVVCVSLAPDSRANTALAAFNSLSVVVAAIALPMLHRRTHRYRAVVVHVEGPTDHEAIVAALGRQLPEASIARRFFESFCQIVIRNADARAMIEEIFADHGRELLAWNDNRLGRVWVHACAAWALCWHLGVFKVLSSVMNLIERVFARRA